MRKSIFDHRLRHCGSARPAFSLAELVVSVGVLVLLVSLSGQVLSLTSRTSGQAKALTEVNQRLRAFEQTIREDLRNVDRGSSLILIQGNPINAYWTRKGREADSNANPADGYPHPKDPERDDPSGSGQLASPRADMLMIFTAREATSYIHPNVTANLQQVVYGHAELGQYVSPPAGGPYDFVPDTIPFPANPAVPYSAAAEGWHLARRSVLLLPTPSPVGLTPPWASTLDQGVDPGADPEQSVLNGSVDVVGNFKYVDQVLRFDDMGLGTTGGFPWYWPRLFDTVSGRGPKPFARSKLDETPPPSLAKRLGHYFLPNCASFKVEWAIDPQSSLVGGRLTGEKQVYWIDQGAKVDPGAAWFETGPLASLGAAWAEADASDPNGARTLALDTLLMFPLGGQGAQEYTLQDRFSMDQWPEWHRDHPFASSPARPNLAVFTATRGTPSTSTGPGEIVRDDVFPAALKITLDLFDDGHRLERPVRHVIVAAVGG